MKPVMPNPAAFTKSVVLGSLTSTFFELTFNFIGVRNFKNLAIEPGRFLGIRGVCYLSIFLEKISSSPNPFRLVVKMFAKEGGVIL